MTREEAIRLLDLNREYLKNTNNIGLKDDIEALDMAIQALEQMPEVTSTMQTGQFDYVPIRETRGFQGREQRITREEAIEIFKDWIDEGVEYDDGYAARDLYEDEEQAVIMAIKALSQGPRFWVDKDGIIHKLVTMELVPDAVSRQEVLELAYDMSEIDGEHFTEPCMVVDVEDIQNLPSVTHKPIECDDAVSRKAVLNAIEHEDKWLLAAKGHNGLTEIAFSGLKARVDALPSVNPQPICEEREKGECPYYAG